MKTPLSIFVPIHNHYAFQNKFNVIGKLLKNNLHLINQSGIYGVLLWYETIDPTHEQKVFEHKFKFYTSGSYIDGNSVYLGSVVKDETMYSLDTINTHIHESQKIYTTYHLYELFDLQNIQIDSISEPEPKQLKEKTKIKIMKRSPNV